MSQPPKATNAKTRLLALIIALPVIAYGAYLTIQAYAPALHTRLGYTPALFGDEARGYGLVVVMLGGIPLLLLCRSRRQAALLGTSLGVVLLAAIISLAYA